MRFAADEWLWGVLCAVCLGVILVVQGLRVSRARSRFGREEQVLSLLTERTGVRRAVRGVLSCTAVALAFLAAAQPQYGKGTRVLPATNLDVVLVLDYSKSMYARDVSPSRISRAKVEVAKLVRELGGARFGAVAFAGESIAFPLTSDGGAIAQFFRGLEPNDLPLGGTAIARALESGRTLFERDPLSKNHERVMILITDGEDLEGDPVAVARTAGASGVRVEVVQIGGQSPEPIPVVDETGAVRGLRKDAAGKILTTQLSSEGEAQLASVAAEGKGQVVRAADGDVGIGEMTNRLRRLMTEELSERVETVYADVFHYPLALAVLLLMIEVAVGEARKRVIRPEPPLGRVRRRRSRRVRASAALFVTCAPGVFGCAQVDRVFERESPQVNEAMEALRSSAPDLASKLLVEYLETGECEEGVIGVGARTRNYSAAAYDLALTFSALSKKGSKKRNAPPSLLGGSSQAQNGAQGGPTGQLPVPSAPGTPGASDEMEPAAKHQIDCAIRLLAPIFEDRTKPAELRARAHYLAGNLELLRQEYEAAVTSYDSAIRLAPGVLEGEGDALGLSVAHNRAYALRLLQEKSQQEEESSNQNDQSEENQDEGDEGEKESDNEDSEEDQSQDDNEEQDASDPQQDESEEGDKDEQDESKESDEGQDPKSDSGQPPEQTEAERKPPAEQSEENSSASRDERMLDLLEQAPTLQQHDAKQRKGQIRGRMTMEDK